jgi:hypothetical protein
METLIQLIGIAILINFYTFWFNPFDIQQWKDKQITRLLEWAIDKEYFWVQPFLRLLYCEKCIGFWIGLIVYKDIFLAAILALVAYKVKYFITNGNQ